jgi:hypothetical protein
MSSRKAIPNDFAKETGAVIRLPKSLFLRFAAFLFVTAALDHRQPRILWETRIGIRSLATIENRITVRLDEPHVTTMRAQTSFTLLGFPSRLFHLYRILREQCLFTASQK